MIALALLSSVLGTVLSLLCLKNLRDLRKFSDVGHESLSSASLAVCVPARNEAARIGDLLEDLLQQTILPDHVLVLDDQSTDETAAIVNQYSNRDQRIKLISGSPLPAEWVGKMWACEQLLEQCETTLALFLDADVRLLPTSLAGLLAEWEQGTPDLISIFPKQRVGFWDGLLVNHIFTTLMYLLPVSRVEIDPNPMLVAGCGQAQSFVVERLKMAGGYASVRATLSEGPQLARHLKRNALRVRIMDGCPLFSCHMYNGLSEAIRGFSRSAYDGLGSIFSAALVTLILFATFCLPWLLVLVTPDLWKWILPSQILVFASYAMLGRKFQIGFWFWPTLPFGVLLTCGVMWCSAWLSLRGKRIDWKGRKYQDSAEGRKSANP